VDVQEQSGASDDEVGAGAAEGLESGEQKRRRRRGRRGGRRANRHRNGERADLPAGAGEAGGGQSGEVLLAAASVEEEWPDLIGDIVSEDEAASERESVEKAADESEWRSETSSAAKGGEQAPSSGSSAERDHNHDLGRGTASAEANEDDLDKPKRGGWWQRRSFF
jgi:ribonuclease E